MSAFETGRANLNTTRANLEQAKVDRDNARREYERYKGWAIKATPLVGETVDPVPTGR